MSDTSNAINSNTLNLIHAFALQMFPDDSGEWTVSEIVIATQRQYNAPDDVQFNEQQFRHAVRGLRQRKEKFPTAASIEEIPCQDAARYPPASARLILRTVIRGRLPNNFIQNQHITKVK